MSEMTIERIEKRYKQATSNHSAYNMMIIVSCDVGKLSIVNATPEAPHVQGKTRNSHFARGKRLFSSIGQSFMA